MKNIAAFTAPVPSFPGYVSVNRTESGDVSITVRATASTKLGVSICGVDCQPGGSGCNNYCARDSDAPVPARAPARDIVVQGRSAELTIPAAEWERIKAS